MLLHTGLVPQAKLFMLEKLFFSESDYVFILLLLHDFKTTPPF